MTTAKNTPLPKSADSAPWTSVLTPKKPLLHIPIRELWHYRDLIVLLVRRDLVTLNKQTVLGPLWFFIQPVISGVVFTIIFGRIARIPTDEIPPFLFFLSGTTMWYYFSSVLTRNATTFTSNAPLFTKVYFPRLAVPVAQSISSVWNFLIQFMIFLAFYFYFLWMGAPIQFSYRIIILPALILQTALLGIGVGCLISALTTRFRDFQLAVAPGIQLWMYGSCIFYPRSMVPDQLQWLMTLNPVVPIIEAFRFAMMGQGKVEISQWLASVAITLFFLVLGLAAFGRAEKTFADTI